MKREAKKKSKVDVRKMLSRIIALVILSAMVIASCSTLIYYLLASAK